MTLQYNIIEGQPDRPTGIARISQWSLGSAVAGSLALHALAVAVAVVALSGRGPVVDDSAAITVFVEPDAAPVATATESKPTLEAALQPPPPDTPPPEPPTPDFAPPPPEALAPPDFKSPPPPPRPRVAPARRAPAAPTAPAQTAPSVPATAPPAAAPSIVPGWNALLAAWLAAHKTYPDEARQRSEEGEVTIRFTVGGDGRVGEVALVKGSGSAALDSAALAMLRGAALPAPGTEATRTVRIRFRLND